MKQIATVEKDVRSIFYGMASIISFLIIGKSLSFFKDIAIAWRFGVSDVVDAYTYIFNIYQWPIGLFFSILSSIFIPFVIKNSSKEPKKINLFIGEFFGSVILVSIILGAVFYVCIIYGLNDNWLGLSGASKKVALDIISPMSLILPLGLVISLLSAWVMSIGGHRNTLLESCPSLVILIGLVMPIGSKDMVLVFGTVLGYMLQLFILLYIVRSEQRWVAPTFSFYSNYWGAISFGLGWLVFGQGLMGATALIDQQFASQFGTGALSQLNYANKIVSIFISLGALALGRSVLPIFSNMASSRVDALMRLANRLAVALFLVGTIIAVIGWVSSDWVVDLVFRRGAFTGQDVTDVAELYRFGLLQIPFYLSGVLIFSLNAVLGRHLVNSTAMVIGAVCKIVSLYIFVPIYGLVGLVATGALMYFFQLTILVCFRVSRNNY